MELGRKIKEYRLDKEWTQEDLAEKLYVSRQTIHNWENDKTYPDIHSLLRLSQIFDVSLDQLIKGDIDMMKKKITDHDRENFNRASNILAVLFILLLVSFPILYYFLDTKAFLIWIPLGIITFYAAYRVDKLKKEYGIHTYKEILAFQEGKTLDEIESAKEEGKAPYQQVLLVIAFAVFGFLFAYFVLSILGK